MRALRPYAALAIALVTAAGAHPAAAQVTTQNGKVTLDSLVRALQAGDAAINFVSVEPARHRVLDSLATAFRDLRASDLTIDDFVAAAWAEPPRFLDILRWDRDRVTRTTQPALHRGLIRLQQVATAAEVGLGPRIRKQLSTADYDKFVGPMETLNTRALEAAEAEATKRLQRYEMKYGANAPRLNPVETTLNYVVNRLGFRPGGNGPSPFEIVATYSNSEVTAVRSASDLKLVSGAHAGIRYYMFDTPPAQGTLDKIIHPGIIAFGVTSLSPLDRPLDSPVRTGRRIGGFLDWGTVRFALTGGKDWRALIGTGAQIVPHLF